MIIGLLGSRGYPSSYGGYETFVRELAPHLVRAGHEVVVYSRYGPARGSWVVDGVECKRTFGIDTQSLSTLSYGLTGAWDLRRRHLDAALVLNCANGYWLQMIRSAGIPVAMNVDGLEWERGKWNSLARAVFRGGAVLAARHADALVADSRAIAEIWQARFGVRPQFIPYGAHPIDDAATDELDRLGLEPGSYVLTVARLVPENQVELALDAVAGLDPQIRPLHVVAGSATAPSPLSARLKRLTSERRDVRWLGHVSNRRLLAQLFRHCAGYIHGHMVGGTNPALLEALAAGAAVLAFDSPFNREVIGDQDHERILFTNAAELTARLSELLGSEELRRRLGRRNQERVRARYSWSQACDSYLGLLEQLNHNGPRRGAA